MNQSIESKWMNSQLSPTELIAQKQALRQHMLALRESLGAEQAADWSQQMVNQLLNSDLLDRPAAHTIALYVAMRQEADFSWAWQALRDRGFDLCFPRTIQADGINTLTFHRIPHQGNVRDHLIPARFGLLEPVASAPICDPEIVVLPGLAFDRAGNRLGWGKGYYDHYLTITRPLHDLAANRPILIGAAYPDQLLDHVPAGPHDQAVDYLVTPSGIIRTADERRASK